MKEKNWSYIGSQERKKEIKYRRIKTEKRENGREGCNLK